MQPDEMKNRAIPFTARALQSLYVIAALLCSFVIIFLVKNIDPQKDKAFYQVSLTGFALFSLFVAVPSLGVFLLWRRIKAGWWLSICFDGLIVATTIVVLMSEIVCHVKISHSFNVAFVATFVFFSVVSMLLALPRSRSFFSYSSSAVEGTQFV
jgi:hypothetical protein